MEESGNLMVQNRGNANKRRENRKVIFRVIPLDVSPQTTHMSPGELLLEWVKVMFLLLDSSEPFSVGDDDPTTETTVEADEDSAIDPIVEGIVGTPSRWELLIERFKGRIVFGGANIGLKNAGDMKNGLPKRWEKFGWHRLIISAVVIIFSGTKRFPTSILLLPLCLLVSQWKRSLDSVDVALKDPVELGRDPDPMDEGGEQSGEEEQVMDSDQKEVSWCECSFSSSSFAFTVHSRRGDRMKQEGAILERPIKVPVKRLWYKLQEDYEFMFIPFMTLVPLFSMSRCLSLVISTLVYVVGKHYTLNSNFESRRPKEEAIC